MQIAERREMKKLMLQRTSSIVKYTLYVQFLSLNPLLEYFYFHKLRPPKLFISKDLLKFAVLFVHTGFYIEYLFFYYLKQTETLCYLSSTLGRLFRGNRN